MNVRRDVKFQRDFMDEMLGRTSGRVGLLRVERGLKDVVQDRSLLHVEDDREFFKETHVLALE